MFFTFLFVMEPSFGFLPFEEAPLDLRTPRTLRACIASEDPKALEEAHHIVSTIYESMPQKTANTSYGFKFACYPELMAWLMRGPAIGKDILEIAGADGYNAALLAFVAKSVTVNDISDDLTHFEALKRFSPSLKDKLFSLPGNILEIDMQGKQFGVILCRNFIHLLTDSDRHRFLQKVNDLLVPGGIFVVSATSHMTPDITDFLKENPDVTRIKTIQGLVFQDGGAFATMRLFVEAFPCAEDEDPTAFESVTMNTFTKKKEGAYSSLNVEAFSLFSPQIRELIVQNFPKYQKAMEAGAQTGKFVVLSNVIRPYLPQTLENIICREAQLRAFYSYEVDAHTGHSVVLSLENQGSITTQAVTISLKPWVIPGLAEILASLKAKAGDDTLD